MVEVSANPGRELSDYGPRMPEITSQPQNQTKPSLHLNLNLQKKTKVL